jgi:ubiquitin-protein ligase
MQEGSQSGSQGGSDTSSVHSYVYHQDDTSSEEGDQQAQQKRQAQKRRRIQQHEKHEKLNKLYAMIEMDRLMTTIVDEAINSIYNRDNLDSLKSKIDISFDEFVYTRMIPYFIYTAIEQLSKDDIQILFRKWTEFLGYDMNLEQYCNQLLSPFLAIENYLFYVFEQLSPKDLKELLFCLLQIIAKHKKYFIGKPLKKRQPPPVVIPVVIPKFEVVEQIPSFKNHYYEKDSWLQGALLPRTMNRIVKDLKNLKEVLSSLTDAQVLIFVSEESLLLWKFMLVPPSDTPYYGGMFEFHMILPPNYPTQPPKVQLMTTGENTIRFNPNLYPNGKVCLSLLGTWVGPRWNPRGSNLSEVILAILGQIMGTKNPLSNEPGFDLVQGTALAHINSAKNYMAYLRIQTLVTTMIGSVLGKNSYSTEFYSFILFYYMKNFKVKILPDLIQWSEKKIPSPVSFGWSIAGQIHNPDWWKTTYLDYKRNMQKYIHEMDKIVDCIILVLSSIR